MANRTIQLLDFKNMGYSNSTMTDLNHLGRSLLTRPHMFEDVITRVFASKNYYSNNPLTSALNSIKNSKVELTSNVHEWRLMGATIRPLVVVSDPDTSNKTKGKGRQEFDIILDEDWFLPGDVIAPGAPDYQCRVQSAPEKNSAGYTYRLRLISDEVNAFVPEKFFKPGTPWSKLFSNYGEADVQDGSTLFSTPVAMSIKIGKMRKKYEITDYAAEQVLAFKVQDEKGQTYDRWIRYAEAEYWSQWEREKEIALWYSKSSNTIPSVKTYMVDTFPGIHEQLDNAYTQTYTTFSAKMLTDFLMDVFYSRIEPGKSRNLKVFTGEYGMKLFNDAMQTLVAKQQTQVLSSSFSPIEKVSSPLHTNAYSVGYQFVQFKMFNGCVLELIHNPIYDNRSINNVIDDYTGYPVESMRFTFLDFDNSDSTPNIQLLEKKDGFKYGYVNGLISPSGPTTGGTMAHSGEFYSLHASKEFGVKIVDPTRCGQLICGRA